MAGIRPKGGKRVKKQRTGFVRRLVVMLAVFAVLISALLLQVGALQDKSEQ